MERGMPLDWGLRLAERRLYKHNMPSQQREVLRKLLNKAKNTAFGQYYEFRRLLQSSDPVVAFQERVPIHDYNLLFEKWWHRTLAGEANVCWPGKVKFFALSSGTSNAASKRIPITPDMFSALRRNAFGLFATFPAFHIPGKTYTRSWLGIGGSSSLQKVDDHFEGYLSGINTKKRPFWSRGYFKPGNEIGGISDFDERTKLIAAKAPEWDIGVVIGIPHWVLITLEYILEYHSLNSIKEIWPDLRLFVSGGTDYRPYRKAINKLIGQPLIYLNTYIASEGFIGHQTSPASFDLQMLMDAGIFFEFIPFEDRHLAHNRDFLTPERICTIEEVVANKDYALVMSTCSGAWRYLLGDVVRFTDPGQGLFRITGRTKYYLNLCSEHLTGDNTNEAIRRTELDLKISIPEYTVVPVQKDRYIGHHWYVETDAKVSPELLRSTLDYHLRRLNDDYHTERNSRLSIELQIVEPNTFYQWQKARGQHNGQSKVPRVIRGELLADWLAYIGSTISPNRG